MDFTGLFSWPAFFPGCVGATVCRGGGDLEKEAQLGATCSSIASLKMAAAVLKVQHEHVCVMLYWAFCVWILL